MPSIAELMCRSPITVDARACTADAQRVAEHQHVHHLLVIDDDELVGLVCTCDLELSLPTYSVSHVMQSPIVSIGETDSAEQASDVMQECGVGCLPVVDDNGTLIGVVTRRDLRRAGVLHGESGVDRCASCGDSHHLVTNNPGVPVFCRECIEQGRRNGLPGMYFTLGGGD